MSRLQILRWVCAVVVCTIAAPIAVADMIDIDPAADGSVQDVQHDGVFDVVDPSDLDLRNFDLQSFKLDSRGIAEFNLSGIPAGAIVDSAALVFTIGSFTSSTTSVFVDYYAGNGLLTVDDATIAASGLGSFNAAALGLGQHSFGIPAEVVQNLLPNGILGLRLTTPLNSGNTQLVSSAADGSPPGPLLMVIYQVPEPSTMVLGAMALIGLAACGRRRRQK